TSLQSSSSNSPCCASFVSKISSDGSTLVYSTYLSGASGLPWSATYANAITVDAAGHAYVAGETSEQDFPLFNPLQTMLSADRFNPSATSLTAFLAKLNASGTALNFSTFFGGSGGSHGTGVAVDVAENAYLTGTSYSTDLPVTPGAFQQSVVTPPAY